MPSQAVFGFPAHAIASFLEQHRAAFDAELASYSPARRAEVAAVVAGFGIAADAFRRVSQARAVADRGNRQPQVVTAPALSDQIDTKQLARMLGVKDRQARNVGAANNLGTLVGGHYVWSRAATAAYLEERMSA